VHANVRACTPLPPQNLHGKEGVDGSSPSEGSKIPAQRRFFVAQTGTTEHLLGKEGIEDRGRLDNSESCGNQERFLGPPAALRSWGQVLGTNDGWLGPNGSSARAIDA
jgi:hypothetical protein